MDKPPRIESELLLYTDFISSARRVFRAMTQKNRWDFEVWRRLLRLSIILLMSVSIACTHAVAPVIPPMPEFESVAIVSKGPTDELKARFGAALGNSDSLTGVKVGAGAGALAGAGMAIACGPFVFLCAISTVPIGAMVGAAGGGLADSGVDTLKEPSQEQLLVLDELFGVVVEKRTIHLEVRDALVREIPPDRLADTSLAEGLLQLSFFDVRFTQTSTGKYTLTLKFLVIAQWNLSTRHLSNGRRLYRHTTSALSLKEWVGNDGEILNQAFDDCVDGLVEQMVEDIQFRES
jgi:hypothetical protein